MDAWLTGKTDDSVVEPACAIVTGRAKRGTSRITRMLAEVATQAAQGAELTKTPIIFASAWGEIETMIDLLNQIVDGAEGLSPLRFKNSVHNAASGLLSIASKNRAFSTAIAAGTETVECGLLEAFSALETHPEVILAVGDDRLPEPLDRLSEYQGAAMAIRLTREPNPESLGAASFPSYSFQTRGDQNPNANPTEKIFPLIRAVREQLPGPIKLGNLTLELSFPKPAETQPNET